MAIHQEHGFAGRGRHASLCSNLRGRSECAGSRQYATKTKSVFIMIVASLKVCNLCNLNTVYSGVSLTLAVAAASQYIQALTPTSKVKGIRFEQNSWNGRWAQLYCMN